MLRYPGLFLVLALIAGAFGYGGLAGSLAELLQTLLFVFVALAALGCVINRTQEPMDRGREGRVGGSDPAPDGNHSALGQPDKRRTKTSMKAFAR